jgi:hypothetical protein
VAGKRPESTADIVILRSDQLELAQDLVRLLKTLAIVLLVLSLGLFALGIYLARDWRREALRACGIGFLFAGAIALVARALAGNAVVDALAIPRPSVPRRRPRGAWVLQCSFRRPPRR